MLKFRDAKRCQNRDVRNKDVKDRDAKNRNARNRDAKNREAKNRDVKEDRERERERAIESKREREREVSARKQCSHSFFRGIVLPRCILGFMCVPSLAFWKPQLKSPEWLKVGHRDKYEQT